MSEPQREALYRQVATMINDGLGPLPVSGQRLPSERRLCEFYRVSRVTMRAALKLLADQGVISSSAARGWFVSPARRPAEPGVDHLIGFSELAASQGQHAEARVLGALVRDATIDEAEKLSIVAGAPIFVLRRLRFLGGLVIAVDDSRIPLSICPDVADNDFSHRSLYAVLRESPEPVIPVLADYAVQAVAADEQQARLLELPTGMPLLVASQTTRDQLGRTFELGRTAYRGDRFRFRASIGVRDRTDTFAGTARLKTAPAG